MAVEEYARPVCQGARSSVQACRLHLDEGFENVVVKTIQLTGFRDQEHRDRSAYSYEVEASMYEHHAQALNEKGICVPAWGGVQWQPEGAVMVLGDLCTDWRQEPDPVHGRSREQRLRLSHDEALAALRWLARFHAHFWQGPAQERAAASVQGSSGVAAPSPDEAPMLQVSGTQGKLWSTGGYWSLDKRQSDVAKMELEWGKWLDAMSPVFPAETADPHVRGLGGCLAEMAPALHDALKWHAKNGSTIMHGDFKTANIYFRDAPPAAAKAQPSAHTIRLHAQPDVDANGGRETTESGGAERVAGDGPLPVYDVAACDLQWAGAGLGVQDAMYLIWTSVEPSAVEGGGARELLNAYRAALLEALAAEGASEEVLDSLPLSVVHEQYELALLDYVRYLIGAMWGSTTPESIARLSSNINHGMHKRDAAHQLALIQEAADLVRGRWSRLRPFGPAEQSDWDSLPVALRVCATAVHVAEQAGSIIRCYLGSSAADLQLKMKKAEDPQTAADIESERCLLSGLRCTFPQVAVIGEEGEQPPGNINCNVIVGTPCYRHVLRHLAVAVRGGQVPASVLEASEQDVCVWVDPLDGTRELLMNNAAAVTVLVGVAIQGKPAFGVVHQVFVDDKTDHQWGIEVNQPGLTLGAFLDEGGVRMRGQQELSFTGRTWWGGRGLGVWRNQTPFTKAETPGGSCILATTRRKYSPGLEAMLAKIQGDQTIREGGAGCKCTLILEGRASHWIMDTPDTKRWDTCAVEALLEATGGFLVDVRGRPYDYSKSVAAQPANAHGVVAGGSAWAWDRVAKPLSWEQQCTG